MYVLRQNNDGFEIIDNKDGEVYLNVGENAAGPFFRVAVTPPASPTAPGIAGTIAWNSQFFYICVATNSWMRVAIAAW